MRIPTALALSVALCLPTGSAWAGAEKLVDPTRPPSATPGPTEAARALSPCVQAVLTRDGISIAIVNGHIVRAGDRLADYLIKEVTSNGVRYTRAGHEGFARLVQAKLGYTNNKAP